MTITATARSTDGRRFHLEGGTSAEWTPGTMLVLHTSAGELMAQVLDAGAGVVVGPASGERPPRAGIQPFGSAEAEIATASVLAGWQERSGASLRIGTWGSSGVDAQALLRPGGFGRHTFLCGQSGSGKTYALGVLLEQLILDTELRMVVFDPNGDFRQLRRPRPGAPAGPSARIMGTRIRVLGPAAGGPAEDAEPLRMRFVTMPRHARAALLRLDPIRDRGEYNLFLTSLADNPDHDVAGVVRDLKSGDDDQRALGQRIENLGLLEWGSWAMDLTSAAEIIDTEETRVTVMDLGGFAEPVEPAAVALDVVEHLWARRQARRPSLLVIDEAHNLCPAQPANEVAHALTERLVQIAAEGRKYGLWLLLSTQRPSKIHPQVLSQCDNLMVMRMNSPADVAHLAEVFGFAPPRMLELAPFFQQGEALLAGGFVPRPALVRMGERITVEGGGDVSVPMPARR